MAPPFGGASFLCIYYASVICYNTIISYDSNGNAKTVTDGANHTAEFEYDSSGNCISKTLKYTSEGAQKTVTEHYVYDENNNLVQIIDSSGNITSTEYNSMGKVALATDEKGRRTSYEYDNLGNLIEINYADGTSESFTYDIVLTELGHDREQYPDFLIHDSTIFDGVDERQVARALMLAQQKSIDLGIQYICLLNSDMI